MKRSELKEYVTQVLLEVADYPCEIQGKLVRKSMGFSGYEREVVCEGTISDANKYATKSELNFVNSTDSRFGGHYTDELSVYEFCANPEYYGELMESEMTAQDSLARLVGENDQVLEELDSEQVSLFINELMQNESFVETRVIPVFSNISVKILEGMVDPKQINRFLETLISEGIKCVFGGDLELSESETRFATQQLRSELDSHIESMTEVCDSCADPENKGILFKNYQKMISDHRHFLPIK